MKRALCFLCLALFILLVVQPNISAGTTPAQERVPEYSETAKTNEDILSSRCQSEAVIVIDPSKGGSDIGYDKENGLSQKDLTMQLSIAIGQALENVGYTVYYTRWYDEMNTYTVNEETGEINEDAAQAQSDEARLAYASAQKAQYVLSVSFNSADPLQKGFSLFTQPNDQTLLELARAIAGQIQSTNYTTYEGLDTDHYSNFTILSQKDMPVILMQMGYLTNSEDYSKISDTDFQERLAKAIAQAFLDTVN